jgi:hypothetical protein
VGFAKLKKSIVNPIRTLLKPLLGAISFDAQQGSIFRYFKQSRKMAKPTNIVLLVQCVEDLYCFGMFGQIALSVREQQPIRVEQYVLRSLRVGEARSILSFVASRLFINPLHSFRWVRLYNSFCDGVAYRSTSIRPVGDVIDLFRAWSVWRKLTDKESLRQLKIDYVVVGDLVNDSYLRFKPAPTVDLKDFYLFILLWQAHRDTRRAEGYFSRVKPRVYLTSYSTYIQHGIPVRVALKHGVRVYSFGNYQEFAKELSIEDWVHTKNPDSYAKDFSEMDAQEMKLAIAETGLATRLSGGIDSATAYMKKSAYAESGLEVPDVWNAAVVFLHDFYDSPHVYREMVFPDFWEWITFTIETLTSLGLPFFLKPHPNQISLSDAVLNELRTRYPNLTIIPSGVTNKQLAEAGMACAVTVYGTVAHEMAYLGVPTIACARHPHISFDFCKTARSREEYAELLQHIGDIKTDVELMRRQSLAFCYMHSLNLTDEKKMLRDSAIKYRFACNANQEEGDLIGDLKQLALLPAFKQKITALTKKIHQ